MHLSTPDFERDWRELPNGSMVWLSYNIFGNFGKPLLSFGSWNVSGGKGVLASKMSVKRDEISLEITRGDIDWFGNKWSLSAIDSGKLSLSLSFSSSIVTDLSFDRRVESANIASFPTTCFPIMTLPNWSLSASFYTSPKSAFLSLSSVVSWLVS